MAYQSPKLDVVSLRVSAPEYSDGRDTASCCDGSCCYGYGDSSCSSVFWG